MYLTASSGSLRLMVSSICLAVVLNDFCGSWNFSTMGGVANPSFTAAGICGCPASEGGPEAAWLFAFGLGAACFFAAFFGGVLTTTGGRLSFPDGTGNACTGIASVGEAGGMGTALWAVRWCGGSSDVCARISCGMSTSKTINVAARAASLP